MIDEAGQVSLSNLLYLSRVPRNIRLVGDQQQLSQPNRVAHQVDSGHSCLNYAMANEPVFPEERGVSFASSCRMTASITKVMAELFDAGELQVADVNTANKVQWEGQA